MIWFILYVIIGAIFGIKCGDEYVSWVVFFLLWPMFAILFIGAWFLHCSGFRIK